MGRFFNFEGKTSGIKNLQLDAAFAAIPIEDISESIQNNIVVILQGLEKKIAINRQLNQNLEAVIADVMDYKFFIKRRNATQKVYWRYCLNKSRW